MVGPQHAPECGAASLQGGDLGSPPPLQQGMSASAPQLQWAWAEAPFCKPTKSYTQRSHPQHATHQGASSQVYEPKKSKLVLLKNKRPSALLPAPNPTWNSSTYPAKIPIKNLLDKF